MDTSTPPDIRTLLEKNGNPPIKVKIVNLVGAPQYNGQIGMVCSYQEDSGRYSVELLDKKKKKQN